MLELEDSALGTSSFLMILAISRWHTHCDIKDPSHLIDAVSQESARGAQSDCAHLKRLEYQVAK